MASLFPGFKTQILVSEAICLQIFLSHFQDRNNFQVIISNDFDFLSVDNVAGVSEGKEENLFILTEKLFDISP